MLKLPYGTSNFSQIAYEDYYFIDRTLYIAKLEQLGERYLFFLRPRRFGKTIFISMLQCYYGLEYAAQFSKIFGRFAIGQQPTTLANSYLVLRLDFSRINTQTQASTQAGFLENVNQGIKGSANFWLPIRTILLKPMLPISQQAKNPVLSSAASLSEPKTIK